jgi:ELWxxDGT repeat protein
LPPWPQFELVRAGSIVYFAAPDAPHGRELWRTDGTDEGTALVRDIVPGPAGSHPRELAAWGDRLVFTACDGAGCEPWTSDGTEDGTSRYADLVPGPLSSDPKTFVSDGVRLLFEAGSAEFGREVWWVPEPDHGAAGIVALLVLASLRWRRVIPNP